MKQFAKNFSAQISKKANLNYLMYTPDDYSHTSQNKYPLILFLHGMGERGHDLELVKRHGIPNYIEENSDFPFIAVSPQCPLTSTWLREIDALYELLKHIIHNYNIDTSHIYLTGISMGGFGTWHLAEAYPKLFAALIPICGGTEDNIGFPERINILKDIPIWAFHGAKDYTVPIEKSQELVDVLEKHNGNIKFTVYPEGTHNVWTRTYNNKEIYEWLLEQKNDNFEI